MSTHNINKKNDTFGKKKKVSYPEFCIMIWCYFLAHLCCFCNKILVWVTHLE